VPCFELKIIRDQHKASSHSAGSLYRDVTEHALAAVDRPGNDSCNCTPCSKQYCCWGTFFERFSMKVSTAIPTDSYVALQFIAAVFCAYTADNNGTVASCLCTGLDRPQGLQMVKASRIFRQSAHEGAKVVSTTHRPPLPRWYSFLLEAELTPGPSKLLCKLLTLHYAVFLGAQSKTSVNTFAPDVGIWREGEDKIHKFSRRYLFLCVK
jgi:hypothetical protein